MKQDAESALDHSLEDLAYIITKKMDTPECQYESPYPSGHYYRAIRAYVQLFKPKNVLDIGTHMGWSAHAFAADIGDGTVNTYDVKKKIDITHPRIKYTILTEKDGCTKLPFDTFDFMFIDIDHKGGLEWEMHKKIQESSYKGFVYWDDILSNVEMVTFWEKLDIPKVLVDWHKYGFGVTKYE